MSPDVISWVILCFHAFIKIQVLIHASYGDSVRARYGVKNLPILEEKRNLRNQVTSEISQINKHTSFQLPQTTFSTRLKDATYNYSRYWLAFIGQPSAPHYWWIGSHSFLFPLVFKTCHCPSQLEDNSIFSEYNLRVIFFCISSC